MDNNRVCENCGKKYLLGRGNYSLETLVKRSRLCKHCFHEEKLKLNVGDIIYHISDSDIARDRFLTYDDIEERVVGIVNKRDRIWDLILKDTEGHRIRIDDINVSDLEVAKEYIDTINEFHRYKYEIEREELLDRVKEIDKILNGGD